MGLCVTCKNETERFVNYLGEEVSKCSIHGDNQSYFSENLVGYNALVCEEYVRKSTGMIGYCLQQVNENKEWEFITSNGLYGNELHIHIYETRKLAEDKITSYEHKRTQQVVEVAYSV
jgi:hypothetical protein